MSFSQATFEKTRDPLRVRTNTIPLVTEGFPLYPPTKVKKWLIKFLSINMYKLLEPSGITVVLLVGRKRGGDYNTSTFLFKSVFPLDYPV